MTNNELIAKIKAEIEKQIKDPQEYCYGISSVNKLRELLSFLSTLESEKPINPDDAMKELDEKIALVKQRGTWDGVDVDKYMDEVRGREPEKPMDLEEEVKRYYSDNFEYLSSDQPTLSILTNVARHFAEWGYLRAAEKYNEVEYSRQRAEESVPNDLEEAANEFAVFYDQGTCDGIAQDCFKAGAKWQKEQMMKEAIHYVVQDDLDPHGASYNIPFIRLGTVALKPKGIGVGDKVCIIIVKED